MAEKQSTKTGTLAEPIAAALAASGQAVVTLAENLATREARLGAIRDWSLIPDPDALIVAAATLGVEQGDEGEQGEMVAALRLVTMARDAIAALAVGIDVSTLVTAVLESTKPLAALIDSASLTGFDVPEEVHNAVTNAATVVENAGQVTAAKVAKAGTPRKTTGEKPWESAGPLVRMVVTGPDGFRSAQKASNLASVSSSTKQRFGATLAQMAGAPITDAYAAAFGGVPTTITTTSGAFTLTREG